MEISATQKFPQERKVAPPERFEHGKPSVSQRVTDSTSVNRDSDISLLARSARLLFIMCAVMAVGFGARLSALEKFTPAEGTGYKFGIIGGAMMLLLLLYPLRKRFRFLDRMGSAPAWFRVHMALGVMGPILILYHANFSLGATNSNIALFAMLLVAFSGIAGRYIYGKIHNGLYGSKTDLQELLANATSLLNRIESDVGGASGSIAMKLAEFGTAALEPKKNFTSSLFRTLELPFVSRFAQTRILIAVNKTIEANARTHSWSSKQKRMHYKIARKHVISYMYGVVKASQLSFYERLFGLWHVLHVPLFFLLIITGIIHVVAVHLY